jgi:hypothetical protein
VGELDDDWISGLRQAGHGDCGGAEKRLGQLQHRYHLFIVVGEFGTASVITAHFLIAGITMPNTMRLENQLLCNPAFVIAERQR